MRTIDVRRNEIIVVNNASTDETGELLSRLKDTVVVMHNDCNKGFVEACNQAAAQARGEFLVFLNNDTIVLPGWLSTLEKTMDDPSVGVAGSMLIYPDGTLQEAGGIIWKDGTGCNYGRGQDPSEKRFQFRREVDYCSGASLMVRRDVFEKLGGFDMRYAPAYYEDADLCFAARSMGYKVVYQPKSRVVHLEGATAGKDLASGMKRYQEINRTKFVNKWRNILDESHELTNPITIQHGKRSGRSVIVFDHKVPTPDQDAGSVRMAAILEALSGWGQTSFVPVIRNVSLRYEEHLEERGIEIIYPADVRRILRDRHFDIAVLCRAFVADIVFKSIRQFCHTTRIIFDTIDVHFLRLEREFALTGKRSAGRQARFLKKQETRLSQASDQVWCVTEADKQALALAHEAGTPIEVVPTIHKLENRGLPFDSREGLLFIGGFAHPPNIDAIHYFLRDIFPLVQKAIPDIKFYVVGSGVPPEITAYNSDNIIVTGYVPNVDEFFHNCRVFVTPLRYGAGMKGKIGQALSYGLPVVSTSIGTEGMNLADGIQCLVADEAAAFAEAIIRLYHNGALWQRLSDNGYQHVSENYTPEIVSQHVLKLLDELMTKSS